MPNCLNHDRTPETPCKLASAGFCEGRRRFACRSDRGGCGRSYMENAKPEGRPPNNDGLTKADRVRKCRGNLGTSGTGKTWYVVRDDSIEATGDSKAAIVAVVLGTRRSVQLVYLYPGRSIALLSGYPVGMRRWILQEWKLDLGHKQ